MHIFKDVIAVLNTAPCLNVPGCAVECPDVFFLNLFNRPAKASVTNSGVQHKRQQQSRSGDQVLVSSSHRPHWPKSVGSFV